MKKERNLLKSELDSVLDQSENKPDWGEHYQYEVDHPNEWP